MEVFTVVLDDSSSHVWGYPYPKPAYSQPRITNVHNNSTMHHTPANLMSLSMFMESIFHQETFEKTFESYIQGTSTPLMNLTRIRELQYGMHSQCFVIIHPT